MFDYIKGILTHKNNLNNTSLTVEANGIGYLVGITARDFTKLGLIASEIKIYVVLLHREDNMSLCGFLQREDRDIFRILTSVSGVGPKMALTLLDEFDSCELISLVIKGDFKEITRAKGVGAKLAQKIILELKDKLINLQNTLPITFAEDVQIKDEQALQDAQTVLIALGYEREEIKKAVSQAVKFVTNQNNPEEILKETLKVLSGSLI
ncbi:MAG: Holliday junction branch migration protein RuvA [Candidatus Gastranaerophilales bacterium]|nr:Holliday junction branch migration protein RuvA [Candidatus Gastranaerophilales bacterium]